MAVFLCLYFFLSASEKYSTFDDSNGGEILIDTKNSEYIFDFKLDANTVKINSKKDSAFADLKFALVCPLTIYGPFKWPNIIKYIESGHSKPINIGNLIEENKSCDDGNTLFLIVFDYVNYFFPIYFCSVTWNDIISENKNIFDEGSEVELLFDKNGPYCSSYSEGNHYTGDFSSKLTIKKNKKKN